MKYCGHCGSQMEDSADVCVNCKTPVKNNIFTTPTSNKKESRTIVFVALFVLLAVLFCIGCYWFAEYTFYKNLF